MKTSRGYRALTYLYGGSKKFMFFIGIGSYGLIKEISKTKHNLPRFAGESCSIFKFILDWENIGNKHHEQYVVSFW